jgi:hypothetical protein
MGFAVQKLVWDAESRAGRGGGRDGAPLRYVMDTLGAWGTRRVLAWLIPTVSPHDGGESFIHSTSSFSVCVSLSSTNSLSCVVVIIYQTCCCWRRFLVAGRVLVFETRSDSPLFASNDDTSSTPTTSTSTLSIFDSSLRNWLRSRLRNAFYSSDPIYPTSTLATMASITRQPFAELGDSRLQLLQSAKNRQNGNALIFTLVIVQV